MRYQNRIYIQNNNSALRNRNNVNFNMSSDMCVFNMPVFNLSGGTKIVCSASTSGSTYFITTATTIPVTFNFTGNTETFSGTNTSFKYEVYKYIDTINVFSNTPSYKSDIIPYSGFSGTNMVSQSIPIQDLTIDGEYLVKGYYLFNICTDFLGRLGKNIDTLFYKKGTKYGIYDDNLDWYFIAIKEPDKPSFLINGSNNLPSNSLQQQTILGKQPEEEYDDDANLIPELPFRTFTINGYSGSFIVTLNGLVLSPDVDYTFSGTVVTMNDDILPDDIITVISTTNGTGKSLMTTNLFIDTPPISGATNEQNDNTYYFNTTTQKYEIYATVKPSESDSLIVMINGVTLANGVDFYLSVSDPNRVILEGDLVLGDIITMVYYPQASVVNGINSNDTLVSFMIEQIPTKPNGAFILEVADTKVFTNIVFTANTPYMVGVTAYGIPLTVTGSVGTQLYYRVKNEKNYVTLCGTIISAATYSDTIPIIIQSNTINSY